MSNTVQQDGNENFSEPRVPESEIEGDSDRPHESTDLSSQEGPTSAFPPPPSRNHNIEVHNEEILPYVNDPKCLVGFIVPLPKPEGSGDTPVRFLIYTPPPPPLKAPDDGEKEGKRHKVGRKWQEEVREAKTSDAKLASWKGLKSSALKGISSVMSKTSSSSVDFLGRLNMGEKDNADGENPDKLILFYPAEFPSNPDEMRTEFIDTMMRAKTKAQRDAIIASGLLPAAEAVDILATVVWPFGGLLEIDGVWAYSSIRGAKTAHTLNKRLDGSHPDSQLSLKFIPLKQIDLLSHYLECRCHEIDKKKFPTFKIPPNDTELLQAIGWSPSDDHASYQDIRWETDEVIEDLKSVFKKSAKEWVKWLHKYEVNPEKALKK